MASLLIPFVLTCALFADRAQIGLETGGRGVLPLLAIVAPLAAIATLVRSGRRTLRFSVRPLFVVGVLPYLVLTAALPVLGVLFHGYPDRTLLALTGASTAFSFLVIGAAMAACNDRSWSGWLFVAIMVQLLYAAGQTIYLTKGVGSELFQPFHEWDLFFVDLQGQFVQGRSSGLYGNPNELGTWAAVAGMLCWTMLPSRIRAVGFACAVLALLLSSSRGASAALLVAMLVGVALLSSRGRLAFGPALRALLMFGLATVLAGAAAFALEPSGALDRLGALTSIVTEGLESDPNLAGRLDYWSAVSVLSTIYPWGTWGPSELLLGTAIDSSWFAAFAQGSVVYLGALAVLFIAALAADRRDTPSSLQLVGVVIATAGLTQTPFGYPVIVLFWVLLGAGLQSAVRGAPPKGVIGVSAAAPARNQRPPSAARKAGT